MTRLAPRDLRHAIRAGLLDPLSMAPSEDVSEREFTAMVVAVARGLGWRVYHPRPAIERSGKWCTPVQGDVGFPDMTIVRGDRLLFIELKAARGRLSESQREWLNALGRVPNVTACVLRPSDWASLVALLQKEDRR